MGRKVNPAEEPGEIFLRVLFFRINQSHDHEKTAYRPLSRHV